MKKLLIAIAICLLVWGFVYEYREHKVDHVLSSGDTISPDGSAPSSGSPMNSDVAFTPTEQPQTVKQVVVPGSAPSTTAPAAPVPPSPTTTPTKADPPAASPTPDPQVSKSPAEDTIAPNPPNGTVFTGTGHFQVYRQGNLTWRLNTDTGQACILFATDAEWRKPRVFEHGCAQR
jgi:hypothetical protein